MRNVLRRVKLSRMSPDYAIVERARLQAQKKLPASPALHGAGRGALQTVHRNAEGQFAQRSVGGPDPWTKKPTPAIWPRLCDSSQTSDPNRHSS